MTMRPMAGNTGRPTMKNAVFAFLMALAFLSVWPEDPTIARGAQEAVSPPVGQPAPGADLDQSIEKTLKIEQENLRQLQEQLVSVHNLKETAERELDAYKLQMSIHGNLLLLPTSEAADLEKARDDHKATLDAIAVRLEKLRQKQEAVDRLRIQTEEKYTLGEKQLIEIKAETAKDSSARTRITQFEALHDLISDQRKTIFQILDVYTKRIGQLEQTRQALDTLTGRFEQEIPIRKKQDLFKRKASPLGAIGAVSMKDELGRLAEQAALFMTVGFWTQEMRAVWAPGAFSFYMFVLLLFLVYLVFLRIRRCCAAWKVRPVMDSRPWGVRTLELVERSLPLLGVTVFLYAYAQVRLVYSGVPLTRVVVHILVVLLYCRWTWDALKLWSEKNPSGAEQPLISRLRVLIIGTRAFALVYIVVVWMIGEGSVLFLWRVLYEVAFFVWSVSFWKAFRLILSEVLSRKPRWLVFVASVAVGLGYMIAGGGLLVELAGYGKLAIHWYRSWFQSIVVMLWGSLLFCSLRELDVKLPKTSDDQDSGPLERGRPVKWLLLKFSWLAWAGALLLGLLFAWGGTRTIVVGLVEVLTQPIQIGNISLRLIGFVYATVILLCAHAAIRLLRNFVKNRILSDSGLEVGIQESVTTVMVYLLWGLGILLSLNVLGLSTTSIAVAFGALSIGLGFGLQTIFNNFVSGLILLFERPVQVGDVVQVNDMWGTVTKINVRSTVVQTFDNASLIIPNSDMISNQVTNWSFKDLRLRRNIVVGVAYGSDTELVRTTLLEIAHAHPKILKRPKPDVLFEDFGDSALVFKLRLWSTVDHFVTVETDVRLAIDRLFRERNIEIAFPQRDIHIRSTVEKTEPIAKAGT